MPSLEIAIHLSLLITSVVEPVLVIGRGNFKVVMSFINECARNSSRLVRTIANYGIYYGR